jgi:nucleotide-binding universal stress UspA family protein
MWDRLLLAVEGSESGWAAVEFTATLAAETGAQVQVLHVKELPANPRVLPMEGAEQAQEIVDQVVAYLDREAITVDGRVVSMSEDRIANAIVAEASAQGCNAIVLGSRRLRGLGRLVGHGVRGKVLRLSSLPVITAPSPAEEKAS